MRKFRVLGIALLVLLALASCRNYVWGPLPGWGGSSGKSYTAQQVAEAIPDELLVRFGLISNPEDLPEGVYVEQKFLSSTVETESYILSRSSVRSSSFSLQSLITLDGYLYNGAKFSTGNNPIVIAYPAIQDTSSYTVSDYTIEASGLSVVMPDSNTSTSVSFALKGSIEAETSPSFTVDETTITIINPPQPENCIVDPYADNTGYVVGNQDVTAAEGKGMDGSSTSPYTISKLSDVAAINGLIQSQKESHFVLDNDLTLEESWILQNMVDLEVQEARPIKIPAGSNVTFDFNDHTITYNGISDVGQRPFVIEEGGSLVINNGTNNISDENSGGFICTNPSTFGVFEVHGNLTINGGNFTTAGTNDGAVVRTYEGSELIIRDGYFVTEADSCVNSQGNAIIYNGYFLNNSNSTTYPDRFNYCVRNTGNGIMEIFNCEVTGIQGGIAVASGKTIIHDADSRVRNTEVNGQMTTSAFYALYVAGENGEASCIVNGGTFTAEDKEAVHIGNTNKGGDGGLNLEASIQINGGEFKSEKAAYDIHIDYPLGDAVITGGTFVHDKINIKETGTVDLETQLPEGYWLQENTDGLYQVVPSV